MGRVNIAPLVVATSIISLLTAVAVVFLKYWGFIVTGVLLLAFFIMLHYGGQRSYTKGIMGSVVFFLFWFILISLGSMIYLLLWNAVFIPFIYIVIAPLFAYLAARFS